MSCANFNLYFRSVKVQTVTADTPISCHQFNKAIEQNLKRLFIGQDYEEKSTVHEALWRFSSAHDNSHNVLV